MRLTRQTNHAIRLLMYCAVNPDKLSRVGEIAAAYAISELFLFKILQPLVEAGFVQTVRGRNGGIRLGRPAETITLRAVVEATEESFALEDLVDPVGSDSPPIDNGELHSTLQRALDAFSDVLGSVTIAELADQKSSIRRRLGLPDIDLPALATH